MWEIKGSKNIPKFSFIFLFSIPYQKIVNGCINIHEFWNFFCIFGKGFLCILFSQGFDIYQFNTKLFSFSVNLSQVNKYFRKKNICSVMKTKISLNCKLKLT